MKFTLEIELGNDAMRDFSNIADVLQRTAHQIEAEDAGTDVVPQHGFPILDLNGNTVGHWEVTE